MAAGTGQDRTLAPLPAPGVAASLKLLLLRFAPFLIALVIEPWVAPATAAALLRRKLSRTASGYSFGRATTEDGAMRRQVLAAATWLLGVCVLIIVALKITDQNARTWADEAAWVAGGFMAVSIVLSRSGKSGGGERLWLSNLADWSFLIGSGAVLASLLFSLSLL
jgi:hypothetical protein